MGFIVGQTGFITTAKIVQAIVDFPIPRTIKDLWSFLGMSGYCRRFIRDYAKIAKPLTSLLRGEDGRVSENLSKSKPWHLDDAIEAFNKIKNHLKSEEVILAYPD